MRLRTVVLVLIAATLLQAPAWGAGPSLALGLVPSYEDSQKVYAWEGSFSSREVTLPSHRTAARLYGVVFVPKPQAAHRRYPAVVIVPGSGPGVQSFYQWAARDLAGHGYVALTVDPQGVGRSETFGTPPCRGASAKEPCPGVPFQQASNYVDAFTSGLDFLTKRSDVDTSLLGVAGHSLAARGASYVQGLDARVKAIVAWDNLSNDLQGDAGSASGGGLPAALIGGEIPSASEKVTPRVPAMGMASDARGQTDQRNGDPEQKKTAYKLWVAKRMPSMELVFRGAVHGDWAQTKRAPAEAATHLFAYYTRAWFDRWLRGDRAATKRLLATTVLGVRRAAFLSTTFHSAARFDGFGCENLRSC